MARTLKSIIGTAQAGNLPAAAFFFDDRVVWTSQGFSGAETTRPTCALLIGAWRELAIVTHGTQVHRARVLLVGPNVARRLDAVNAGFYSLSLDPANPACRWLRDHVLAGRDTLDLSAQLDAATERRVSEVIDNPGPCADSYRCSQELLQHFFPRLGEAAAIDPRVDAVARWLRRNVPARADMKQLGALCNLSQGRLTHLFTQELGVSIRTYLLWVKMCKAAEMFGREESVTEVALAIGFADSAHMSRVFRTYYAAAPSFLANRDLVKVHSCSHLAG